MQSKRRVRILIQEVEKGKSFGGDHISTYILDRATVYQEVRKLIERLENKSMDKAAVAASSVGTHGAS